MDLNSDGFVILSIVFIGLYFVSLFFGNVSEKRELKQRAVKDYINKVIYRINEMNGSQFEDFVEFVFRDIGYNVKQSPKTRDGGKDLILTTKKGKVYVEIKRYSSRNLVSSSLVLKLIGSAVSDGVYECIFLTTSGYTKDAINTAENSKVKIKLIDIDGFIDILKCCNHNNIMRYLGY